MYNLCVADCFAVRQSSTQIGPHVAEEASIEDGPAYDASHVVQCTVADCNVNCQIVCQQKEKSSTQ